MKKLLLLLLLTISHTSLVYADFDDGMAAYKQGDYEIAYKEWEPLAEQGDAKAQYNLGEMFANGTGATQDDEQAFYWFSKAAEQGDADAQFALSYMYSNSFGAHLDYEQGIFWLTKAAEQEHVLAQHGLGVMHAYGFGVPQNLELAAYWWTKAAEQGDADAQHGLGVMYANGSGVAQDSEKAIYWYTKAAEQGYVGAQVSLGGMYANGDHRDYEKAIYWYTKAVEQGNVSVKFQLNRLLKLQPKIELAEQGDVKKQLELADYYVATEEGDNAIYWYTQAAEHGSEHALTKLGWFYLDRKDTPLDYDKAIYWYTRATEQGVAGAQSQLAEVQFQLGDMHESGVFYAGDVYSNGVEVPRDYEKALFWYTKAAEQGHDAGQWNVERLTKKIDEILETQQ